MNFMAEENSGEGYNSRNEVTFLNEDNLQSTYAAFVNTIALKI